MNEKMELPEGTKLFNGIPCEGNFTVEFDGLHDREVARLEPGQVLRIPMNVPANGLIRAHVGVKENGPGQVRIGWGGEDFDLVFGTFQPGKWTRGATILPGTSPESMELVNTGNGPAWVCEIGLRNLETEEPPLAVTNLSIVAVYKEPTFVRNLVSWLGQFNAINGEYGQIFVSESGLRKV